MKLTFMDNITNIGRHVWRRAALAALLTLGLAGTAQSATLHMAIAPFLPQQEVRQSFQPLVDYLSQASGVTIKLVTFPNYLAFWQKTRNGSPFDIALDSAPVTDFRVERQQWHVIAKMQGRVTQSLVTGPNNLIIDPAKLINKKVAVQPSPSVSALLLYQLFPNPVQQPILVFEPTSRDAAQAVLTGKAQAAVIPTPIAAGYSQLNLVTTTQSVPFLGISVGPNVNPAMAKRLQQALVSLDTTPEGKAILKKSQLRPFVQATDADYAGQAKLLVGTYGY